MEREAVRHKLTTSLAYWHRRACRGQHYPLLACQRLIKNATSEIARRSLRLFQVEHLLFQQGERNCYYKRRTKAVTEPDRYTSLIIDATAQYVCRTPRKFRFEYKGKTLEQKLVGVLVHGAKE